MWRARNEPGESGVGWFLGAMRRSFRELSDLGKNCEWRDEGRESDGNRSVLC